jgi:hypothetical protein
LLPGLAAAALLTSGLALGITPAHAADTALAPTATRWQLGFDDPVATALSADGAYVYALGTRTNPDDSESYVLDTVSTADGTVTEKALELRAGRTTLDGVEDQVDDAVVGPDGTVYASGYHELQDEVGNGESTTGALWTIPSDSSDARMTALDGFLEGQTLSLRDGALVVGGIDAAYLPVAMSGPAATFGTSDTSPALPLPVAEDATGGVDAIAGSVSDGSVWVAGRVYEGEETSTSTLWQVTPDGVTSRPLAGDVVSMTADGHGNAYVGVAVWDENDDVSSSIEIVPAAGGSTASVALDEGDYPEHLAMSPDDTKVVGWGRGWAFAFAPAKPRDVIYTSGDLGSLEDLAFSATKAYAVTGTYSYDEVTETSTTTYQVERVDLPWVAKPVVTEPKPTTPAPTATPPAPTVHLTPAQQKVATVQAKVTKTASAIAKTKAQLRAAKKAHDKVAAKRLSKKVANLKKKLKKQKVALVKAKKAAKKAAHKKNKKR